MHLGEVGAELAGRGLTRRGRALAHAALIRVRVIQHGGRGVGVGVSSLVRYRTTVLVLVGGNRRRPILLDRRHAI